MNSRVLPAASARLLVPTFPEIEPELGELRRSAGLQLALDLFAEPISSGVAIAVELQHLDDFAEERHGRVQHFWGGRCGRPGLCRDFPKVLDEFCQALRLASGEKRELRFVKAVDC